MLKWSYKDASENNIPDGYYKAMIHDCKLTTSRNGNELLVLTFKIEGYSFMPSKFQLTEPHGKYTAPMIQRDIANIAKCFSVPDGTNDPADFEGRKGFIKISHRTRKDNPYVEDLVISFPAPDKGQAEYIKAVQQKQAQQIAQQNADLDTWDPNNPVF